MKWNWQRPEWPAFTYDVGALSGLESRFLQSSGVLIGIRKHLNDDERESVIVGLMSEEAVKTSQIEGEILNRNSVQSSIRKQLGLHVEDHLARPAEAGIAEMMVDVYRTWSEPLSDEVLCAWHAMVTSGRTDLVTVGTYRIHADPMQVVSGPVHRPSVHFEAPPSAKVPAEMSQFVRWFNASAPDGTTPLPPLVRAGIAHLYFVSIHPFEDGNGRIGRAVAEKVLGQSLGQPSLIALAHAIERNRKAYYAELERNNKNMEITDWLVWFGETVLEAQSYSTAWVEFLVKKAQLYARSGGELNARQEKVLSRMFKEGIEGFKGGLSAENYIRITRTSASTATRDLRDLVKKGALTRKGERKGTRYFLNLPA